MTFSITGRCARTGMFGVAITTSSICVGARCPHAKAGLGAVATQNITDPNLANLIFDALANGDDAATAIAHVIKDRDNIDYRQLTVVDAAGNTAQFTGMNILGTNSVSEGQDCIGAGNLLSIEGVPAAMTSRFEELADVHLAERLLSALETGVAAGGEEGPTHSAALIVAHETPFPLVDLRMDWDDEDPVARLRQLWTEYEPQMQAYLDRALNPSAAPSYGVAGDP